MVKFGDSAEYKFFLRRFFFVVILNRPEEQVYVRLVLINCKEVTFSFGEMWVLLLLH